VRISADQSMTEKAPCSILQTRPLQQAKSHSMHRRPGSQQGCGPTTLLC
jgi:hypothetical protein